MFSLTLAMRTATFSSRHGQLKLLNAPTKWSPVTVLRSTVFGRSTNDASVDRPKESVAQSGIIPKIAAHNRAFSSHNLAAVGALVKGSVRNLEMRDIAQIPQPIFWTATLGLLPVVAPSLSFLIFGFTNGLATVQMTYGALVASFFGGTQYISLVKEGATWENVGISLTPTVVSLVGLVMPQMLGFLIITSAMGFTTFIDLTSQQLPKPYRTMRLAFSIPVLGLMLFTCIFRLFH